MAGAVGESHEADPKHGFFKIHGTMVNNSSIQKWYRLQQKNLNQQFIHQVIRGCNCSSFEAKAILETVHEVFAPFFDNASCLKPGQIQLPVIAVDCPPGKSLKNASLVTVNLTLCDDDTDLDIRKKQGVSGLRQHRIYRVCIEAFQQGGLLTVEDLAHRLFNCGQRTICRDIKFFKDKDIFLPLRSTVKDMGRSLSHRKEIIRLWLLGDEYQLIAQKTFHSTGAVRNYVEKFKRVIVLTLQNYDMHTISFLVKLSSTLVKQFQELYETLDIVKHRHDEINNLLKKISFKNH